MAEEGLNPSDPVYGDFFEPPSTPGTLRGDGDDAFPDVPDTQDTSGHYEEPSYEDIDAMLARAEKDLAESERKRQQEVRKQELLLEKICVELIGLVRI